MSPEASAGWSLRIAELLGVRPDEAEEEHLNRLVEGGVREDADLDFKQERYGNKDSERRELAGDIAAMANDRGGLIVIGLRDENDVAVDLTSVALDGEEGRIRLIAATNLAPPVAFKVRPVSSRADPARGYYLIIVPPSTLRPHAVRADRNLRYPRRDGSTTRWLSESEVADMYRDRFRVAATQADRVTRILEDGLGAMDLSEDAFVASALVPTGSGSMSIDLARTRAMEQWAMDLAPAWYDGGLFDKHQAPPSAGVGAHRVTLTMIHETDRPPSLAYAELYDDGAGFACVRLPDPRPGWGGQRQDTWVLNERLLGGLARCLYLLGRHAAENCGAWGDALAEARVVGRRQMRLAYPHPMAGSQAVERGRALSLAIESHRTVLLDALAKVGPSSCRRPASSPPTTFTPSARPRCGSSTPTGASAWAAFRFRPSRGFAAGRNATGSR